MDTSSAIAESAAGESGGPESGEAGSTAVYRPYLDGLRAVAVYLVVVFHAGSGSFPGGFVGVDVFFVLSGFLVTQLLLRDLDGTGGIRFGRFYARRFRRLLPAAFVALTVTAIVYTAIASPAEVLATVGAFKAAFLYSTNWYFIHEATGYFGADITTNPVLHFWSLAVEEQFYLLWPLVLGGGFALTRRMDRDRQMRMLRIAIAVTAVASAVWAMSLRHTNPDRAYYGTDARAYELLAGAFLALIPAYIASLARYQRSIRAATIGALAGLFVVASSAVDLDAIERGIAVTLITVVLIVALETAEGGPVRWVLSTPTVVYLGKISYGTYLWHWLVILVIFRTFEISVAATIAVATLVATALAALSYQLLEQPIRISPLLNRHRGAVITAGLAISVVSALVLIPAIVDPADATAPTVQGTTSGFTPVPATPSWRDAKKGNGPVVNCLGKATSACTIVRGTGKHLLLMGDSHAWMVIPTFTDIARRENLTLSVATKGGCPWQRGLYAPAVQAFGGTISPADCKAVKDDAYERVIPELKPDVIVAVNFGYEDPKQFVYFADANGKFLNPADPASVRALETATNQSLASLRADGRKVVIVEPIPRAPFDPVKCLSQARVLEACRYVAPTLPSPLETFYRRLPKQDDNVHSANFDRLVCPFLPICDPIVNRQIVKWDQSHLTVAFAKTMAPEVDDYLKQIGAIPR
jgi:peptidoglycan/LPS O-acetylase OafA/YrhL